MREIWYIGRGYHTTDGRGASLVELPQRCIQLYTFKGEVALDPFRGVGTTAKAAIKTGRHLICVDVNPEYAEKAPKRTSEFLAQTKLPPPPEGVFL